MSRLAALALLLLLPAAPAAAQLSHLVMVVVAAPGNAPDDTGFGAVAKAFEISSFEVAQVDYVAFLNAVAKSDPNGLYSPNMNVTFGIKRLGAPGNHSYQVLDGAPSLPVRHVSYYDALRFANWLHNGKPTAPQGPATTEDGAYTITAQRVADGTIARNPGAKFFLPSEDQWYKAAYYDGESGSYFEYPTRSDDEPTCASSLATTLPNRANCDDAVGTVVPVGASSAGPWGTFDQAGNVFEWTEGAIGATRVMRGGSWFSVPADQAASFRASSDPAQQTSTLGFRVAPEPGSAAGALACLALLALLGRRRARGALAGLAAVVALGAPAQPAAAASCSDHLVPAALAAGQPQDQTIFAKLCVPASSPTAGIADTLLVFVHGITYDHRYWDVADPTGGSDRYSFVKAAHARGFATLAIDRLGSGQSSHPLSAQVTIDSNAHTVHEVVQAVRGGAIPGDFGTVVLVGHSYGVWTSWFELTRYSDVDAAVFTGATHGLTLVDAPFMVVSNSYPAEADPLYAGSGLDPGYLTTQPGTRYHVFYAPGPVDPAVVAQDEATKGTVTNAEIQNYQLILNEPLDIRVPVFLTMGSHDTLFCGPAPGGADCSSEAALIAFEQPFLGPDLPSLDAYILPGGGHDMNPMWNAGLYFDASLDWVESLVSP